MYCWMNIYIVSLQNKEGFKEIKYLMEHREREKEGLIKIIFKMK